MESSKLLELKNVLDEVIIQNGHKVLLFSQYAEMVKELMVFLDGMSLKYLLIWGDTPKRDRADMQEMFNNDKSMDLMVGTDAMSQGLNFTAADYVVNYDDFWAPAVMDQRADRAHRLGQKNVVTVIGFVCRNTIEERIRNVLYQKSKISAQVLGDDTEDSVLRRLGPKDIAKLL
jgi:SNF2 family DNA or RNA helicase